MNELNEELITRWIDGDLNEDEQSQMERHLESHPELLEERASSLELGKLLREQISAELEVPSPEFFAGRINHEIDRIEGENEVIVRKPKAASVSRPWIMSLMAAAAALAIGFFGGFQFGTETPDAKPSETEILAAAEHTVLFSPDQQVRVELLDSDEATVILLEGVEGLPESLELAGQPEGLFLASYHEGANWQ